jgi:DNA polymerase
MDIFVDFETRSKVDIRVAGAPKYAADESTLPMMMAYGIRKKQKQWLMTVDEINAYRANDPSTHPKCPEDWAQLVDDDRVTFHAQNAAFEIYIYNCVCRDRWGWPDVPIDRWQCTAAKSVAANMPRGLDMMVKRLGLPASVQKTARGKALIQMLSVPTKAQKTAKRPVLDKKGNKVRKPTGKNGRLLIQYEVNPQSEQYAESIGAETFPGAHDGRLYFFRTDPDLMEEFAAYNVQDIVAEIAADAALPPMPQSEIDLWRIDRQINMRGIPVDLPLCEGAMAVYDREVNLAHVEMAEITNGEVTKCTQRQRLLDWINKRVNFGDSMADPIIPQFLDKHSDRSTWPDIITCENAAGEVPKVLRALELRQLSGGTAVAKYKAAIAFVEKDGRVRDQMLYHGARTGRWTGKGVQPHNMLRAKTLDDSFIAAVTSGNHSLVQMMADVEGMTVQEVLKKCVRGLIRAEPGHKLVVSDFAGIEARVLHWLVGGEDKLELFRQNQDVYIHSALDIYSCEPADIADWNEDAKKWKIKPEFSEYRQIGKAAELGLGYGMGWETFQARCKLDGIAIDEDMARRVVGNWREANDKVAAFWKNIEKACKFVIRNQRHRKAVKLCGLVVGYHPLGYLTIQLPSGRKLYYYQPRLDDSGRILYRDGSKMGKPENQYCIDQYGGKICENIIQAIARDLLVHSMRIVHKAGLPIIFHVHDEVVAHVKKSNKEAFGIVHAAMETVPDWAQTLPLMAESYESERYTK